VTINSRLVAKFPIAYFGHSRLREDLLQSFGIVGMSFCYGSSKSRSLPMMNVIGASKILGRFFSNHNVAASPYPPDCEPKRTSQGSCLQRSGPLQEVIKVAQHALLDSSIRSIRYSCKGIATSTSTGSSMNVAAAPQLLTGSSAAA
jgi:hypothetical protein